MNISGEFVVLKKNVKGDKVYATLGDKETFSKLSVSAPATFSQLLVENQQVNRLELQNVVFGNGQYGPYFSVNSIVQIKNEKI